jgi:DNA-binding IclR family transcriptional regulator
MKDRESSQEVTLTVERGLEVLRAFRSERIPLSNAELVRRTGLSKATVSRLTTTLMRTGFLRRACGSRQFELGAGVLGMGHAYLEVNSVTRLVNPFLQDLADRLDVCVALAVAHRLDMLYVGCGVSAKIATLRTGIGSLIPMESTALGRAYLFALPPTERRARMDAIREATGGNANKVRRSIETSFAELKELGACVCVGTYKRNAYGIALPLRVGHGRILMSLGFGAVELQPDPVKIRRRLISELRASASTLIDMLDDVDCEP